MTYSKKYKVEVSLRVNELKFDYMKKSFSLMAPDTLFGAEMTFFYLTEQFPKFKSTVTGRKSMPF